MLSSWALPRRRKIDGSYFLDPGPGLLADPTFWMGEENVCSHTIPRIRVWGSCLEMFLKTPYNHPTSVTSITEVKFFFLRKYSRHFRFVYRLFLTLELTDQSKWIGPLTTLLKHSHFMLHIFYRKDMMTFSGNVFAKSSTHRVPEAKIILRMEEERMNKDSHGGMLKERWRMKKGVYGRFVVAREKSSPSQLYSSSVRKLQDWWSKMEHKAPVKLTQEVSKLISYSFLYLWSYPRQIKVFGALIAAAADASPSP
ncbi:hypothetical protein M0802_011830 [Mischocyttarus mexicanus]|nr:hypothetical protein M0802_011845 [Mischocyttarus mexicanus]KAI4487791.1 hypothetical protein M0802_011830 [Mischocyttarus mexicanus]